MRKIGLVLALALSGGGVALANNNIAGG